MEVRSRRRVNHLIGCIGSVISHEKKKLIGYLRCIYINKLTSQEFKSRYVR
jgi:hypothetical protein